MIAKERAYTYKPSISKPRLNTSNPITKGLLGCWIMNEGAGNVLRDISGNGWDMESTGHSWVIENNRYRVDYSGASSAEAVGSEGMLGGNNEFTLTCTVNGDTWDVDGIIGKYNRPVGDYSTETDFEIYYFSGAISAVITNTAGGQNTQTLVSSPSTSTDYTLTISYNAVRFKGYVNGLQVFDVAETLSLSHDHTFNISDAEGPSVRHFDGRIDNVRLWNRVLSEEEIYSHYLNPDQVISKRLYSYYPSVAAGITGTLSETLEGVSSSIAAILSSIGSISETLEGVTSSTSGLVEVNGSINETLDGVTSNISGIVGVISGTIAVTLEGVTSNISGSIPVAITTTWFDKMSGRIPGVNDITNSPYVAGEID